MDSIVGQFLLASPRLGDTNFARAVVLMIEHNAEGAMGVIINRALDLTIVEAWQEVSDEPCLIDGFIHQGGPVPGPVMALHTHQYASQFEVCEGVHFTAESDDLNWLSQHNTGPTRMLIGYAGWSAMQLEMELAEQSWLIAEACRDDVFTDDPSLWKRLAQPRLGDIGLPNINPDTIPDDPSNN